MCVRVLVLVVVLYIIPTPANGANVFTPPARLATTPRPANQTDDELQGTGAQSASANTSPRTLTKTQKQRLRDILSFHHGTLATKVPVGSNNNPLFGWHVTVYIQQEATYEQICGGSLVKKDTAISAAHCFWDDAGLMPAELFAVTVGQTMRRWQDALLNRSNVSEIVVPPRFLGAQTNFQDDIAVLRLSTPVEYQFGVRPVCVDFGLERARWHLRTGYPGLITGFGLTEENGAPSPTLNFQRLPYVDIRECIAASDPGFLRYLTSDKICAGDQKTGRALCRGDSGGGLVFFDGLMESAVMFLRGIASAAPRNNNACNAFAIGSFTDVYTHRTFLRDNIPNLEQECKTVYGKQLEPKYVLRPVKPKENGNKTEDSNRDINTEDRSPLVNAEANASEPNGSAGNVTQTVKLNSVPLRGSTKPVSVVGNNQAGLNEVKVRGNPNTNIFFFTGSVVDPSRFLQANATPIVVEHRADQPTNIYVFIQNYS